MNSVQTTAISGATPNIAVVLNDGKLEAARTTGATLVLTSANQRDPDGDDGDYRTRTRHLLATVGNLPAAEMALDLVRNSEKIVVVGVRFIDAGCCYPRPTRRLRAENNLVTSDKCYRRDGQFHPNLCRVTGEFEPDRRVDDQYVQRWEQAVKRDQHNHPRNSNPLAILAGIGLITFGLLWELRWRRLVRALSRRAENAEQWAERALHDPLTNLPNRTLLQDRIEQALFRADRTQSHVALLFIDLDDFKHINDEHGHLVGDQMLIAAGDRFRQHLRASDTAARLGGDEFVILLEGNTTSQSVLTVAERLRMALHVPLMIEPEPLTLTASIGVAVSRSGDENPDDLLREADQALLDAKRQGKDQVILAGAEDGVIAGGHYLQSRPNGRLPEHY